MLVVYVRFEMRNDLDSVVSGFGELAAEARRAGGCVRYDLLLDSLDSKQGAIVEMWETEADREAYLLTPAHIEMVARATNDWGMENFRSYFFHQAGDPVVTERVRSETPAAGREEMNGKVLERLRSMAEGSGSDS
jgi:quinol monooxygenase YgiN